MARRKKKKIAKGQSLRTALVFTILIVLLVVISLLFKLFAVLEQSRFDGQHRFTILVLSNTDTSFADILSFAPDSNTVSLLRVSVSTLPEAFPSSQNKQEWRAYIQKFLAIPVDGNVVFKRGGYKALDTDSVLSSMFFRYQSLDLDITIIDIARLWLFAKNVSATAITTKELEKPIDQLSLDKLSSSLFSDETISSENLNISIINGTGVSGLGGRMARFISNMGGHVITVRSSTNTIKRSSIAYASDKTYTFKKIRTLFGYHAIPVQNEAVSDIIITIGEDEAETNLF